MDNFYKELYKDNRRVFSPWYPNYDYVRALLPIWDGLNRELIKGLIQAINDKKGTPQNTTSWDGPDQWIPERVPIQYQALAKRIWSETNGLVNPRYTEGILKFSNRYGLLSLTDDGIYILSDRGKAFINKDVNELYHIDELEGLIKLLQIIADRQPVKRAEIHIDWTEYLGKYSTFVSDNTIQHTYDGRRKNLLARELIAEINSNEYQLTKMGEKYLAEAKKFVQPPQEPNEGAYKSKHDVFKDIDRQFWFVGAYWDEGDQTDRFLEKGIWQNGYEVGGEYSDLVKNMKSGDKIAIKSAFTQKNELPFDINGGTASRMNIKAIGTIIKATADGQSVQVKWEKCNPEKNWYFYTNRNTVWLLDRNNDYARRLILFAFADAEQDFDFWLSQPYWKKKYKLANKAKDDVSSINENITIEDEEDNTAEIPSYTLEDIIGDGCFIPIEKLDTLFKKIKSKKNLILQGPPGTGKTWLAKKLGYALLGSKKDAVVRERMRVVQFHPSMSYEDFVRGYRPISDGKLELKDGILMEAIEVAKSSEGIPYILVIEEINRGNPAQIFGEMLTLLEDTKRRADEAIQLSYSREGDEPVYIPSNLYIIGTMNVADRSLAIVDYALRRRFAFINLEPNFGKQWKDWCKNKTNLDAHIIELISERMIKLNEDISNDHTLGREYRIGHSYTMPKDGETIEDSASWFCEKVESEIFPLLDEYWHGSEDGRAEKAKQELIETIEHA